MGIRLPAFIYQSCPFIHSMIHEVISLIPSQYERSEILKAHMRNKKGSVDSIGELEANGSR
jgi:hypothetical protein